MEWKQETTDILFRMFAKKHHEIRSDYASLGSKGTDRKNISARWNFYLKNYNVRLITDEGKKTRHDTKSIVHFKLIDLVNGGYCDNSVLINNPDRIGQLIIIPKEMAERVLVFGMI